MNAENHPGAYAERIAAFDAQRPQAEGQRQAERGKHHAPAQSALTVPADFHPAAFRFQQALFRQRQGFAVLQVAPANQKGEQDEEEQQPAAERGEEEG